MNRSLDRLLPGIYPRLRRMAASRVRREPPSATLQATDLANDVVLQMVGGSHDIEASNTKQLLAYARKVMDHVLVDRGRRKRAVKNGGGLLRETLRSQVPASFSPLTDVRAIREGLHRLAQEENGPRRVRLLELLFWEDSSLIEAARRMELSRSTANRDWQYARLFLEDYLSASQDSPDEPRP